MTPAHRPKPHPRREDLHVEFDTYGGIVKAVRGVSFSVAGGQDARDRRRIRLRQVRHGAEHHGSDPDAARPHHPGTALLDGIDIIRQKIVNGEDVRGNRIGMIFQDPMSSLNPTMKVGDQIAETLQVHRGSRQQRRTRAPSKLLAMMHIPEAEKRAQQYPFAFSGGMLQRAMIAMAIACEPAVLIADEPTTALDVTIQAQILDLLKELQRKTGMAIILITHDLGVVARMADDVASCTRERSSRKGPPTTSSTARPIPIRWGSRRRCRATRRRKPRAAAHRRNAARPVRSTDRLRYFARCPHAMRLCEDERSAALRRRARITTRIAGCTIRSASATCPDCTAETRREAAGRSKRRHEAFPARTRSRSCMPLTACQSRDLAEREIVGLVGESGSGKSTFGKTLVGLHDKTAGEVYFEGEKLPQQYKPRTSSAMRAGCR